MYHVHVHKDVSCVHAGMSYPCMFESRPLCFIYMCFCNICLSVCLSVCMYLLERASRCVHTCVCESARAHAHGCEHMCIVFEIDFCEQAQLVHAQSPLKAFYSTK